MKFKIFISSLFALFITFSAFADNTPTAAGNGTLTGTVTDKADGSPLIGVTISIPDLKNGTTTNADGKYSLNRVPKGVFLVQVRYIGYATINQKVDFNIFKGDSTAFQKLLIP